MEKLGLPVRLKGNDKYLPIDGRIFKFSCLFSVVSFSFVTQMVRDLSR